MRNIGIGILSVFFYLLISCTHEVYETGDGRYSDMRADYVTMTVRQGLVTTIITDEGESLIVPQGLKYRENTDTILRQLIYYNKKEGQSIEILSNRSVGMLQITEKDKVPSDYTDPLVLNAVWMSTDEQWLNMLIGLKVGASEEEAVQTLILRCDSVSTERNGKVWFTLCHSQGNMPQYYTEDVRLSIPLNDLPDTIHLKADTYSGTVVKEFVKGNKGE